MQWASAMAFRLLVVVMLCVTLFYIIYFLLTVVCYMLCFIKLVYVIVALALQLGVKHRYLLLVKHVIWCQQLCTSFSHGITFCSSFTI